MTTSPASLFSVAPRSVFDELLFEPVDCVFEGGFVSACGPEVADDTVA